MIHHKTILFKKQSNNIRRSFKGYTLEEIHLSENTSFLGSNLCAGKEVCVCQTLLPLLGPKSILSALITSLST